MYINFLCLHYIHHNNFFSYHYIQVYWLNCIWNHYRKQMVDSSTAIYIMPSKWLLKDTGLGWHLQVSNLHDCPWARSKPSATFLGHCYVKLLREIYLECTVRWSSTGRSRSVSITKVQKKHRKGVAGAFHSTCHPQYVQNWVWWLDLNIPSLMHSITEDKSTFMLTLLMVYYNSLNYKHYYIQYLHYRLVLLICITWWF